VPAESQTGSTSRRNYKVHKPDDIDHRDESACRMPGFIRLVVWRHFETAEITLSSQSATGME